MTQLQATGYKEAAADRGPAGGLTMFPYGFRFCWSQGPKILVPGVTIPS